MKLLLLVACHSEVARPSGLGDGMSEGSLTLTSDTPRDADGDGFDTTTDCDDAADLAVSAPGTDATGPGGQCNGWGGAAYVFYGGRTGSLSVSEAHAAIVGDAQQISFGEDLAWVGADLLVGAPGTFVPALATVYLYEGPLWGQYQADDAVLQVVAESPDTQLGEAVDSAGDVDGDGVDDLVMGAPAALGAPSGGQAAWVSGLARGEVALSEADGRYTSTTAGYAGFSVAGAGDVDGDGHGDLLIGAPDESSLLGEFAGAVYVVHGPAAGAHDLAAADAVILGDAARQELGYGVATAGDVDGDGLERRRRGASARSKAAAEHLVEGILEAGVPLASVLLGLVMEGGVERHRRSHGCIIASLM